VVEKLLGSVYKVEKLSFNRFSSKKIYNKHSKNLPKYTPPKKYSRNQNSIQPIKLKQNLMLFSMHVGRKMPSPSKFSRRMKCPLTSNYIIIFFLISRQPTIFFLIIFQ